MTNREQVALIHLKNFLFQYSNKTEHIGTLIDKISEHYTEPQRAYHNLSHILYMLGFFEEYKTDIKKPEQLYLAIWFHDIIYNPLRTDNEEKSAELAYSMLRQLGFGNEILLEVKKYILLTKNHELKVRNNFDLQFFLDIDLAILGETPEKYFEYQNQVRQEYKVVPEYVYRVKRKQVLKHFLKTKRIYKTALFFENREKQARQNLKDEIKFWSTK